MCLIAEKLSLKYTLLGQKMKCGICKAEMEEKAVTYTEDINQSVVVVRHVPAQVCTECGNTWYSLTVAKELEKIIDISMLSICTEVSVIDYAKLVA
jgi:YgiT-type zinc finger domain-containing protein